MFRITEGIKFISCSGIRNWSLSCVNGLRFKIHENELELDDEKEFRSEKFPFVWLRDNCTCSQCFQPASKARFVLMKDLKLDVKPKTVDTHLDENEVKITWEDGHVSEFARDWLLARSFADEKVKQRLAEERGQDQKITWDASYIKNMKQHKFQDVMNCNESLLSWLQDLRLYGLTILNEMESHPKALRALLNRIGFPKSTHYGEEFSVIAKPDPNNLAYTNSSLGLHVDLPFYQYNPGIQFLHCVKQTDMSGGDNEFVDGFNLAGIIRRSHPKYWNLLTKLAINFWDRGSEQFSGEFYKYTSLPTFQLNAFGEVYRVNFNNQVRDNVMNIPLKDVKDLYEALMFLNDLAYDPQNMILYKLQAGECVIFDNQRILHGRRGYALEEGGHRYLQGGYMDWDEVNSKINVLRSSRIET
ncbi:gamma-butyrobetaine dioxygenase-like [Tigriopus californicus]|uniref:gamma-butyrobetaine dioxygenase-like n=1 Tax=Tigriopus californicus TaxID=6832 RepID=UPI0027DA7B8C|nr:gamma-butyrobetaine dioxygenase-like [Tigriopus californicus]